MRILLTNDDSYSSEGIHLLRKELEKYGDVFLVAPKVVQSGKACGITIGPGLDYTKVDDKTYIVEGTPIDCVIFGVAVIKEIDLVVSGCNDGYNYGVDSIYSGTCGACTQSLISAIPSIAFSCKKKEFFAQITKFTSLAMDYILDNNLLSNRYFLNVNYPTPEYQEAKGVKVTKLFYHNIPYGVFELTSSHFKGTRVMEDTLDESYDLGAINNGYISICPLSTSNFNEEIYKQVVNKE